MSERSCPDCKWWKETKGCVHALAGPLWYGPGESIGQNSLALICKHYAERKELCGVEYDLGFRAIVKCVLKKGHKGPHKRPPDPPIAIESPVLWTRNHPSVCATEVPTSLEKAWEQYCEMYDPLFVRLPGETEATSRQIQKERYFAGWQARGKVDKGTVEKSWIGWDEIGQIKHTQEAIDKNND